MIGWLIFAAYVVGWFAFTVPTARWAATQEFTARCHAESATPFSTQRWNYRHHCQDGTHKSGCWRSDGEVTPALLGQTAAVGLIWPLGLPLLAAFVMARRTPPTPNLTTAAIERLERELGIKP